MKKFLASLAILAGMFAAVFSVAAPANAACTTFDEHNKVVMTGCSAGAGGMSGAGQQSQNLPRYTVVDTDDEGRPVWGFVD